MWPKFAFSSKLLMLGIFFCSLNWNSVSAAAAKESKELSAPTKETEKKNAQFPEEDSDMLMEPSNITPLTILRSQEQHFQVSSITAHPFQPLPNAPIAAPRADIHTGVDSHIQAAQNFYPPFFRESPPLGHSRPYFPTPDGPAIPKYASPHPDAAAGPTQRSFDPTILGSGDFGVLRGGTFYPEEEMPYHADDNSDFNQFYGDGNNGHGRPLNEGFIEKYTYPEEQFANFRDFADINTAADSAFSQFVVVYAAKNASKPSTHPRPKNIFEQLELIDREKALEAKKGRPSKSKSKLSTTKLQKKYKKKTNPKDLDYEPLLALS